MNDNLIPFNERTEDEQREIARKGGVASGKSRRERRAIREALAERLGAKDIDELCDMLIERAKQSDRAFEILRDTLGEKPRDEVGIINIDKSLEEMEAFFAGKENKEKGMRTGDEQAEKLTVNQERSKRS